MLRAVPGLASAREWQLTAAAMAISNGISGGGLGNSSP